MWIEAWTMEMMMNDYLEMSFVLFAYSSTGIVLVGTLISFLVCVVRKRKFTCPFVWVDPLFAIALPSLWWYLVPIMNPKVSMSGYALILYVGAAWSLLIFARYVAARIFALAKSKAVLMFSALQVAAFLCGILLTFNMAGC